MVTVFYITWIIIVFLGIAYRLDQKVRFKKRYLSRTERQINAVKELEEQKIAEEHALNLQNVKLEEERKKKVEEAERLRMIEAYSRREAEKSNRFRRFDKSDDDDKLPF